jgi:hypothetical protein
MLKSFVAVAVILAAGAGPVSAQVSQNADVDQVKMRQRTSTFEGILSTAVSSGAENWLRRAQTVMPDRPILNGMPQVHGVRLPDYGVMFQVQVPGLILPIMWPLRDVAYQSQNRSLVMLVRQLQDNAARVQGEERFKLLELIRQIELQLDGTNMNPRSDDRGRSVSAATLVATDAAPRAPRTVDNAIVDDPQGVYRSEVQRALVDAMLEYSQGLSIGSDEWLTVAARGDAPRNPLLPGDAIDSTTLVLRVRGSDLGALRGGTITLEEARKRVQVSEQ